MGDASGAGREALPRDQVGYLHFYNPRGVGWETPASSSFLVATPPFYQETVFDPIRSNQKGQGAYSNQQKGGP